MLASIILLSAMTPMLVGRIQTPENSLTTPATEQIGAPPKALTYDGFYAKCGYLRGLPILGSKNVSDEAFHVLIRRLGMVLQKVPQKEFDLLIKAGSHFSIIGRNEGQTDLPEYADLRNDTKTDWNKRARGLGGLYTSAGEENILELPSDRYRGECIYIHEFAHTLASYMFKEWDPKFNKNWTAAYDHAMKTGLWKDTYSTTDRQEYFAEGVQMYFDCARSVDKPNGVHNQVCNREQLEKYDPDLYHLIDNAYHHNPWRYDGTYNTSSGHSLSR